MLRLVICIAWLIITAISAVAQGHSGWSRSELISKAAELLGQNALPIEAVDELPKNLFLLDPTEEKSCFVGPGDSLSAFRAHDFTTVLMIGDSQRIHTLWLYFPIVNVRDTDRAFKFYANFLGYLFPSWQGAVSWAEDSLTASWDAAGPAFEDPMISYEETITRESVDGAVLATTGIPPDIVTYRITSRPHCERISDYLLAKPRRAFHDPSKRDVAQEFAGVQLFNSRPKPTDVSSTPIFLGEVRGVQRKEATQQLIRFSASGPLAGVAVDLHGWLDAQAQPPNADETWSIIEDDWGYASRFLFLITNPLVSITHSENEYALLVNQASGFVGRKAPSEYISRWRRFSGLLFGAGRRSSPDGRKDEPPDGFATPGRITFENPGSAVPVDVSATPVHLGLLRKYVGTEHVDIQPPYFARIETMTLHIEDQAGNSASIDLANWLRTQTSEYPPPNRQLPISYPSIVFTLDRQRLQIVFSAVKFSAPNGKPVAVDYLRGQLFAGQ